MGEEVEVAELRGLSLSAMKAGRCLAFLRGIGDAGQPMRNVSVASTGARQFELLVALDDLLPSSAQQPVVHADDCRHRQ